MMTDTERLAEIHRLLGDHIAASSAWRVSTERRLDDMQTELEANTEVTSQVREAARAASWLKRAVVWVGGLGAGVYGVWQLLAVLRGSGITPG